MKKIFSFVIVLAAVAMVSCGGNTTKNAAEADAAEATTTEASACTECSEKCDSTAACCAEKADSTKACCAESKDECKAENK